MKENIKYSRFFKTYAAELIFSIIFCIIVFAAYYAGIFESLEVRLLDYRFVSRGDGNSQTFDKIVLVPITEDSINPDVGVGDWPWDRGIYARVIDFLHRADAGAVGFDIFFKNPQEDQTGDIVFAKSIEKAKNVVLANILERIITIDFDLNEAVEIIASLPFEELYNAAADHGFINVEFDTNNSDGVIRKVKVFEQTKDDLSLSLPCAIYSVLASKGIISSSYSAKRGAEELTRPDFFKKSENIKKIIPVTKSRFLKKEGTKNVFGLILPSYEVHEEESFLVNYSGSTVSGSFAEVPFHEIYRAALNHEEHFNENNDPKTAFAESFKGKAVIIGPKAAFFSDMKVTPFGLMPGMEIHASILKNIIDRDYIKRFSHRGSLVCFFLISLLTALFLIRFDASFKDFIFLPLFVFIFVFLSIRLFTGFNLFIEMIPCILLIVLNYVAIRFYQLFIKIIIANRMLRKANKALDLKVQEVTQLYQASRGLNELNDMDLVSETILNNAVLISKARYGSLLLFDEETERLVHKKSISNDHILCSKNEFDLNDKALTAKVAITKETVFIDKSQKPDNWIFNNFPEINQALYIPLTVKNNLSGVMILAVTGNSPDNPDSGKKVHLSDSEILEEKKKAEFTESDRYLLQTFATQASVTMENARLYKLAVFDGLTKLYVHRFFQNRLAQEFKRTRRYKHPLAVLLSDIDHFKSFNDTYGHQVGDIVLAGTADIFTQSVREIDLVARYGGEEFAVVLPQTDPAGAMIVAQRIRTSLEKANFIHPDGRILKVTVSLGIACYNGEEGVDSPKELVKQADLAMYYAKENGRNQCALYDETMTMSEDG